MNGNSQKEILMKSIEIIVPRNLIRKFYPHPEGYGDGDYVVDLINGMYTDVFYREDGDFTTITNDNDLIRYLKKNQKSPREYLFRNGVFSLRNQQDCDIELINEWKKLSPTSIQLDLPNDHKLPNEFMLCFYWIEVGKATIENNRLALDVYELDLISLFNIGIAADFIVSDTNESKIK